MFEGESRENDTRNDGEADSVSDPGIEGDVVGDKLRLVVCILD